MIVALKPSIKENLHASSGIDQHVNIRQRKIAL